MDRAMNTPRRGARETKMVLLLLLSLFKDKTNIFFFPLDIEQWVR